MLKAVRFTILTSYIVTVIVNEFWHTSKGGCTLAAATPYKQTILQSVICKTSDGKMLTSRGTAAACAQ
jgi:hypothetical protein